MGRWIAGIQARMSSKRLPGKSLCDLAGKPLIVRVYERVAATPGVAGVWVLTSTDTSDDPLVEVCHANCIPVRRGPLEDVLARFLALLEEERPDRLARVTGDCPLVDPTFLARQARALAAYGADLVQGLGTGFEGTIGGAGIHSAAAWRSAADSSDPRDREHAGSFHFARARSRLRVVGLPIDTLYQRPALKLSVDDPADLALLRAIYERFAPEHDSLIPLELVLRWLASEEARPWLRHVPRESRDNQDCRALRASQVPELVGVFP